jgi:hypothetical protein
MEARQMRYLKKLKELMTSNEDPHYNNNFKKRFRSIGEKAMKELTLILELNEYDINFNPGGIAVSGDLRLMGMWSEGNGVYISMNKDFPGKPWGDVLYRHIRHMRDFTGGPNNYFKFNLLSDPAALRKTISRLREDDGHSLVVKSLDDGIVECSCGRWCFPRTGFASIEEIEEEFKKHAWR